MSLANDLFSNFRSLIKSCGTLFSLFPVKIKPKLSVRENTLLQSHKLAHQSDTVGTIFCVFHVLVLPEVILKTFIYITT